MLSLRVALVEGRIDEEAFRAAVEHQSPTELFGSGNEAADHGQAETPSAYRSRRLVWSNRVPDRVIARESAHDSRASW
ncbi:hypothetical protein ACH3VS_12825 [Streptomyces sp. WSLK1-3]|uniref:hypothetical protein n=1 Tax=Streptomyces sp. WSLK1-3 TaxID=3375475 RepID=UPI00379123F7